MSFLKPNYSEEQRAAMERGLEKAKQFSPGGAVGATKKVAGKLATNAVKTAQAQAMLMRLNKIATTGKKSARSGARKAFDMYFKNK